MFQGGSLPWLVGCCWLWVEDLSFSIRLHAYPHDMVAHFLWNKLSKRQRWQQCCLLYLSLRGHPPSFSMSSSVWEDTRKWIPKGKVHRAPSWRLANMATVPLHWDSRESWSCPAISSSFMADIHMTLSPCQNTCSKVMDSSLSLGCSPALGPQVAIWGDPSGQWEIGMWLLVPPHTPYSIYLQSYYSIFPCVDFLSHL